MKYLKDYINFYLGCRVALAGGESYILKPSNLPNNWQSLPEPITGKLILRPLSDMTEDEGKEIIQQIHNSIYGYDCQFASIAKYYEIGVGFVAYDAKKDRMSITIEIDRGVEFYYNGTEMIVRQFEITQYLLSKSFDLFNLHEDGLCLYKNKEGGTY
jgi:hypothetical protein